VPESGGATVEGKKDMQRALEGDILEVAYRYLSEGGILRILEGLTSEQLAAKVRKEMKRNLPVEFRKLAKVRRALGETR
jgi:hypothetical protein